MHDIRNTSSASSATQRLCSLGAVLLVFDLTWVSGFGTMGVRLNSEVGKGFTSSSCFPGFVCWFSFVKV
jgi:hypothetical protein